eukprot:6202803-Pleurochrysis_carterae.AAC.2
MQVLSRPSDLTPRKACLAKKRSRVLKRMRADPRRCKYQQRPLARIELPLCALHSSDTELAEIWDFKTSPGSVASLPSSVHP